MLEETRQYFLPVVFAVLLHAAAVVALQVGWEPARQKMREIKPQIVHSKLLVLEPKPAPKVAPKPQTKPPAKPTPEQAQPKPAPKTQPDKPKPDPAIEKARQDRARAEAERRRQEEAARQQRLSQLADSLTQQALAREDEALAEEAADADEVAAQSYRLGIYQQVVGNWSRPPSARNGMQAKLLVELVPTGDVVAVTLLESSGSAAFDQSAEAAVRKARRFEVPSDTALFERHFRRFTLLFRPEDLLR